MPTTWARRLISLFRRSSGLFDQILTQCARGNVGNASTSALASSVSGPILRTRRRVLRGGGSQVVARISRVPDSVILMATTAA